MRKLSIFVAFLLAVWLAMPVAARDDLRVLTAAAATTDQDTAEFRRPKNATGMFVITEVTVGATLLLDLNFYFYAPEIDEWILMKANLPSAGAITGTGVTTLYLGPLNPDFGSGVDLDQIMHLPDIMYIVIDHGNSNEATYTVDIQWIR